MSSLDAAPRPHVADHVFEQLARDIISGRLAPGSGVPPERVLVERFGVSRVLIRQAMHRLAELGLVRVKQGGATLVLDPREATDLRVLGLFYRVSKDALTAADIADIVEKQYLQGLSIVEAAARRAPSPQLDAAIAVVTDAASDPALLGDFAAFERRFWLALAAAAENRIFRMELAWWYEALTEPPLPPEIATAAREVRFAFYAGLAARLAARDAPVEYYLAGVRPILDLVVGRARRSQGGAS